MQSGLEGKAALVVGAGQGMGRATALALAEGGARVACLDMHGERAEAVAAEVRQLGVDAIGLIGNVTSRDFVYEAVARTTEAFGRVDSCIDIVGEGRFKRYLDLDDEDWRELFDINIRQFFHVSQATFRQMLAQGGGGSFVAIASASAFGGAGNLSLLAAEKSAVMSFVRTAAVELGPSGIRVNAVAPGSTRTPRTEFLDEEPHLSDFSARLPVGRRAEASEQAAVFAFLASDRSASITGQTLLVDGGATAQAGRTHEEVLRPDIPAVPWGVERSNVVPGSGTPDSSA